MLIVLGRRWVVWQAEAALLRQFFLLSKNPQGPGIRTSNDGPRPRVPLRSFPAHPMFYQTHTSQSLTIPIGIAASGLHVPCLNLEKSS